MRFDLPKPDRPLRRPSAAAAPVINLDEIEKLLAGKKIFCKACGLPFAIFPPDEYNKHYFTEHADLIDPVAVEAYRAYESEPLLEKRDEQRRNNLIAYTLAILSERYDLRKICLEAGAVVIPQGEA